MSDDPLDPTLRALARRAREEVERGIDDANVEAALSETIGDDRLNVRLAPSQTTRSSARTWSMLAAAASVVVVAVGAAYLLLGRDEQISTQLPPSSQAAVPVTAASPDTTFTVLATTTVPTTASTSTSTTNTTNTTNTTGSTVTTVPAQVIAVIDSLDEVPFEGYLPDAQCLEDDCAQVEYDTSGAVWTFSDGVLINHARGGATVPLPEPWRSADIRDIGLIAIGPDDVAYFSAYQAPESWALVGISVADGDAGQEVVVVESAIDFSGDTEYVSTAEGLAKVGCCGFDQIRPAPDAELLVEFLV